MVQRRQLLHGLHGMISLRIILLTLYFWRSSGTKALSGFLIDNKISDKQQLYILDNYMSGGDIRYHTRFSSKLEKLSILMSSCFFYAFSELCFSRTVSLHMYLWMYDPSFVHACVNSSLACLVPGYIICGITSETVLALVMLSVVLNSGIKQRPPEVLFPSMVLRISIIPMHRLASLRLATARSIYFRRYLFYCSVILIFHF